MKVSPPIWSQSDLFEVGWFLGSVIHRHWVIAMRRWYISVKSIINYIHISYIYSYIQTYIYTDIYIYTYIYIPDEDFGEIRMIHGTKKERTRDMCIHHADGRSQLRCRRSNMKIRLLRCWTLLVFGVVRGGFWWREREVKIWKGR